MAHRNSHDLLAVQGGELGSLTTMSNEKERDSHVYMAKLAEQAERYDGSVDKLEVWMSLLVLGRRIVSPDVTQLLHGSVWRRVV